jgi:hypothetical protein
MTTPAVSLPHFRDLSHTTATAIRFLACGPPPWSVEETDACFIVRDANGQALAYVYFEDEPGRRSAAKLLTRERGAAHRGQHRQAAGPRHKGRFQRALLTRGRPAEQRFAGCPGPRCGVQLLDPSGGAGPGPARAKKASLFSGSVADSAQDRH